MDLTFEVPVQYCSLQHWTLLLSPVTSTTGCCFCFGSIPSFFLELFQYSCLENPMNSMKRQKDRTLKDKLSRSVGTQYATGDQWRNNFRKNEEMESKQKQCSVVDVTGDGSEVQCYKKQYCIRTLNFRSMNKGKLEMVKQEMARVNTDILRNE